MELGQERHVLPNNVKPLHYNLTLEPDLELFTFKGSAKIEIAVLEDSSSITLHAKELDIYSINIEIGSTVLESALDITYDADSERVTVQVGPAALKAGQTATLTCHFIGKLSDSMTGFYRASWKTQEGTQRWLATTHLSPIGARRAFPCFDEPALKATFTVTLIVDSHLTCLSNMDVASETDIDFRGGKRKAVNFEKTPIMSTHIVAFMAGDFKVYKSDKFRLPVQIYCTPDQDIRHGVYAAELAARTLEFYESEFGIPYPLPKMDMVAVPDFPMRGMENWGLTMYSVASLLLDENKSSATNKQAITENVQHELAHQWFGNLVTMEFWDGLWLNEGFARWMAWYACDKFYPEWRVWDEYITTNLRQAFAVDGLRSSHPVEVSIERDDQINQIFDDIAYEKGSAVLRMIANHLGEAVFMDGVKAYLKKHAYNSTKTKDLWVALSEASGKNVEEIASVWTKKVGYPVVSVTEDESQGAIHLKQSRFLASGDILPNDDAVIYPIILGLRDRSCAGDATIFNTREATFPMPDGVTCKLNTEHSGFYRTLYSSKHLERLAQNAKAGLLPISDRAGLISDAGALAEAGYQKTSDFLSLLQSFESEPDYEVWYEINMGLKSLKAACMFEDKEITTGLEAFHGSIINTRARELGWTFGPEDGHVAQRFKALMFNVACSIGDQEAKAAAFDMFARFKDGESDAIHPNIRPTVYRSVLQHGGEVEYDAIMKAYRTTTIPDEKEVILECVGATRDPKLLKRTLDFILSGELKPQDIYSAIQGFRHHRDGVLALWVWMNENWEALYQTGHAVVGFGMLIFMIVAPFTTKHQWQMVQGFFQAKDTKAFDMNLAQALDVILRKQAWMARDKADITEWLHSHGYL